MKRTLLALCLLLLIASGLAALEIQRRWQQPLAIPATGMVFEVQRGDSLRRIAERLERAGVTAQPWLLIAYGRYTGVDSLLKHGEYRLEPGTTASGLLELLARGEVIYYQVTLPEGLTLSQALAVLASDPVLEQQLSGVDDERIITLTADYPGPEGLFLPETYRFARGDSDWQILQRAFAAMEQALAEEWAGRSADSPLQNAYEALILASIIERETGVAAERAEIAGVFVRRLQRQMRLQTDPTVIYGIGDAFDGNLRRSHLRDDANLYNTYRHTGLPPTPIALPGRAAIQAALNPADGDALFFVARGDGSHVFSASLAEHEAAVRKYQLQRRSDYRSSPGEH
ncbi:endolytic transglycosylase MltG [Parahaliea aestuarii]|uniref:Endolytic murein transglycosylase n=1 Tax=Parahaliea aestuarii TaxID=1852021 RepID=A0A5C8ZTK8_9GAMM|nr:endolytic transglycosylase MltG [Parahaliea aestuarii]TXS91124.1 endolytic transglycosylase MltG [Parahaliea aestuarii]